MATGVPQQPSSSSPISSADERAYSTLEVVETDRTTSDANRSGEWAHTLKSGNLEPRETPESLGEKVFLAGKPDHVPIDRSGHYDGLQAVESERKTRKICGLRRRYFWIIVALGALLVIGGAVGGGIAGSSNKSSEPDPRATATSTNVPDSHSMPSQGELYGSSLAAASWKDSDNHTHCRVFFQNRTTGHIMQSAWDDYIAIGVDTASWKVSAVNESDDIMKGTPLAAAVGPLSDFVSPLFLDPNPACF